MMETNNYSHLIEKYLFNQMSESEKREFEIQVESNPSLAEELELQKSLFEAANDEDFKKILPSLKSAEQDYLATLSKKRYLWFSPKNLLLYAASLLLIVLFSWLYFVNNNKVESIELFATYYEPYPMVLSFRGKNDLINGTVNSYNEKNFESVITSMNQLILEDSLGFVPYMYLGIAHLELGNLDKAIENFTVVSDSNNATFRQQANWYIALTYLKANESEKARNILIELSSDMDSIINQESVKEILKSLDSK